MGDSRSCSLEANESPRKENVPELTDCPEREENSSYMPVIETLTNKNIDTLAVTNGEREVSLTPEMNLTDILPLTSTPKNKEGTLCLLLNEKTLNIVTPKTYATTGTQCTPMYVTTGTQCTSKMYVTTGTQYMLEDNPIENAENRKSEGVTIGTQYYDITLEKSDDCESILQESCVSSKNTSNLQKDNENMNCKPHRQNTNLFTTGASTCSDDNPECPEGYESIVPETDFDNGFSTDASGSCKVQNEPLILKITSPTEQSFSKRPLDLPNDKRTQKDVSIEMELQEVHCELRSKSAEIKHNPQYSSIMCHRWSSPESLDEEDIIEAREGRPIKKNKETQKQNSEEKKEKCTSGKVSKSTYCVPNKEKRIRVSKAQASCAFSSLNVQRGSSPESLDEDDCNDKDVSKRIGHMKKKEKGRSTAKRVSISEPVILVVDSDDGASKSGGQMQKKKHSKTTKKVISTPVRDFPSSAVNVSKNDETNAKDSVKADDSVIELPVEGDSSLLDNPVFNSIPSPPVFFKPIIKVKPKNYFFDDMSSQDSQSHQAVTVSQNIVKISQQIPRITARVSARDYSSSPGWSDEDMEEDCRAKSSEESTASSRAQLSNKDLSGGKRVRLATPEQAGPSQRSDYSRKKRPFVVTSRRRWSAPSVPRQQLKDGERTPSRRKSSQDAVKQGNHLPDTSVESTLVHPIVSYSSSSGESSEGESKSSAKQQNSAVTSTSKKSPKKALLPLSQKTTPTGESIWDSDSDEKVPVRKLTQPSDRKRFQLQGKLVPQKKRKLDCLDSDSDNSAGVVNCSKVSRQSKGRPGHYRCKRREYTEEERVNILNFIVNKKLMYRIGSRSMWEKMEKAKVCKGRTWQSLKEHFRKQILPRIDTFQLPKEVKAEFKKMKSLK